jgi:hypothetical protein
MNARTTTLWIVLALVLAACVAPMPAPPPKVQLPKVEQTLPIQNAPAQNKLPVTQPSLDPWAYPDDTMKSMALYEQHQKEKAAYALLRDLMTAQQAPADVTKESSAYALLRDLLADNQNLIYEKMSGLPIQVLPYIENYVAVEEARKSLPDNVLPALITSDANRSSIDHSKVGVPPEVRTAIEQYLESLNMPEMNNVEKIKAIEHYAVGTPSEVQSAIQQYIESLQTP